MKKPFLLLTAFVLIVGLFCSCNQTEPTNPAPAADKPNWVEVPTPESSSSMTIICVPPVDEQIHADDELAAFMNDQCCRVARQQDGLFYLGVPGSESEQPMELRYYSATKQSIRLLRMTYVPGGRLGSSDAPYRLSFESGELQRIILRGTIDDKKAASGPHRVNIGEPTVANTLSLFWRENDQIRVQANDGGSASTLTIVGGADTQLADFEGIGAGIETGYRVTYPLSATFANGQVTYAIPAEQTYVADNYANDLMPMEGTVTNATAGEFNIQPIGAVLCLQLTGSKRVKRIVLTVPSDQDQKMISGRFQTGGSNLEPQGDNTKTITLEGGEEGVLLSSTPTKFHFVLPAPIALLSGTQFKVEFTDGTSMTKTTSAVINYLGQGRYVPLAVLSVE